MRAVRVRPLAAVRGPVVTITEEGADEHINFLSHRYEGKDYTYTPGQVRVRYVIAIERVDVYDG